MEQQNAVPNGAIAVCPRKKNDKTPAVFYADRMEFKGNVVPYNEVETIRIMGTSSEGTLLNNYNAYAMFTLTNGKKVTWTVRGAEFLGIGKAKMKQELYHAMFEVCMETVVKARANRYLEEIHNGRTVTIAKININSRDLTGKSFLKEVTVPFTELSGVELWRGQIQIKNKEDKWAVNSPMTSQDNAICLMPVIQTLIKEAAANQFV